MRIVRRFLFPMAWVVVICGGALRRARATLAGSLFGSRGRNLRFDPDGYYTYRNIYVGDDVILGRAAVLMAAESKIVIGSKVMFGPEVMIIAGNHNTSVLGSAMFDVQEKRPEDDQDVVIEDDVWIGARATILKGVTIHRGAIVGAGSLVTRDVPPYAVAVGSPARLLRFRWDLAGILEHERRMYPAERRLDPDYLQAGLEERTGYKQDARGRSAGE